MAPDFSMALCLRPQEAFAARMKITTFTWWIKGVLLVSPTPAHFRLEDAANSWPALGSLPGRRHRWVRRSSRWECRGRTASRSPGFRSREGLGQPLDLCATQRKCIGLRLLPLGLMVGVGAGEISQIFFHRAPCSAPAAALTSRADT